MASTFDTLRCTTRLMKWLGPWSSDHEMPSRVVRRTVEIQPAKPGQQPLEAWVYKPEGEEPMGAVLVTPGLFPNGPQDQRLDRISRVFASAGLLVLTPFLPDFMSLRLSERVIDDIDRAFGTLLEQPDLPAGARPGVFSVSFGSLPALRLASAAHRADQVGALVVWGGYADWRETMHFAFTGEVNGVQYKEYDPTNHPVIFMNLVEQMPDVPVAPDLLIQGWLQFVLATWNKPEQKARFREVARELAEKLPSEARQLFLIGCGAEPGGYELCTRLIAQAQGDFLDPRPMLGGLRCPVYLVHARNDDVIPANQLDRLVQAIPKHVNLTTYLTGVYGHAGGRGQGGGGLALAPSIVREAITMMGILRGLSRMGLHRNAVRNAVDPSARRATLS